MRKILKKNIDCAMTYMAYLDEDGNVYLETGREDEDKLANVRISKGLSPYDAVRCGMRCRAENLREEDACRSSLLTPRR